MRKYLQENYVIKSVSSGSDLLEHIQPHAIASLSEEQFRCLRNQLLVSCVGLQHTHRDKLRILPVFPRLIPGVVSQHRNTIVSRECIPVEANIKCIHQLALLPMIPHTFFTADLHLTRLVCPDVEQLSEIDVLRIAVENFPTQPKELQLAFLSRLDEIRRDIPDSLIEDLKERVFVPSVNGSLQAPTEIYDPESDVAELLLPGDARLPRLSSQEDESFVEALRKLRLLNNSFTAPLARERIIFVSKHRSTRTGVNSLAEKLLDMMDSQRIDYNAIGESIGLHWLPTNRGLCDPEGCRDKRDESLCKDVLPLLTGNREIHSEDLRGALGWDQKIPLRIVVQQFKHVLSNVVRLPSTSSDLQKLIHEIGTRSTELDGETILELKRHSADSSWIPTSGTKELSPTRFAVFSLHDHLPVFLQVKKSLVNDSGSKRFLELMGCTTRYAV
jgi:hypothetical protein